MNYNYFHGKIFILRRLHMFKEFCPFDYEKPLCYVHMHYCFLFKFSIFMLNQQLVYKLNIKLY